MINEMPNTKEVLALYKTTSWYSSNRYTVEELKNGLMNSWAIVSVYDENELVGIGIVVLDGSFQSFITDMIVLLSYRKQGIGKKLLETLINHAKNNGLKRLQLFAS